jgi:hypothetical protein
LAGCSGLASPMLPNRIQPLTDMESNELRTKLQGILEALADGHTCEEILAADRTLTYHDIFHAVADAPTSFWKSSKARAPGEAASQKAKPSPTPIRSRVD